MSNIEIYNKQTGLSGSQQTIREALDGILAKEENPVSLTDKIADLISKAYLETGYHLPEPIEINIMADAVVADLLQLCKSFAIRVPEIEIAFYRGVRKEYGDFTGLSVTRFFEFLKSYSMHNDRLAASADRATAALPVKAEPTDEEKFSTAKALAMKAYNEVKAGKEILIFGRSVYDFIDQYGLFKFTNDEKRAFYETGKENLIREKQTDLAGKGDMFFKNRLKEQIESIQTESDKETIKARAKVLALENYLQSVIFEEVDFYSLLAGLPGIEK